jgi:hypothetical protein
VILRGLYSVRLNIANGDERGVEIVSNTVSFVVLIHIQFLHASEGWHPALFEGSNQVASGIPAFAGMTT